MAFAVGVGMVSGGTGGNTGTGGTGGVCWFRGSQVDKESSIFLIFVLGTGMGDQCCLASWVHSKRNTRTVSVSQRKRDMKATHTNPVIR